MFPDKSPEEIDRIDRAYYETFPGIKSYHDYATTQAQYNGYGTNLFGCRYYGADGHKMINLLVQGSGSYLLKTVVINIDKYIRETGCPARFQMNIHDECSFELNGADPQCILDIKDIMEDFDFYVPIVADIEVTKETWADKVEFEKDLPAIKEFLKGAKGYEETKS